jgi:hypothetical protein
VSSRAQAAIAFYPPTNFLTMDAWAIQKCAGERCHDSATSPESRLVGCAIQTCPDKVRMASPLQYITEAAPIMILHGNSDPLVQHNQGKQLYMAQGLQGSDLYQLAQSPARKLERLPDR